MIAVYIAVQIAIHTVMCNVTITIRVYFADSARAHHTVRVTTERECLLVGVVITNIEPINIS